MADKIRILFVCLGNIIRSPLAENIFAHLAQQSGVGEKYFVDSAGIDDYHIGESPDARMRQVARGYGLNYDGRARQFSRADFDRFDLIIPMDMNNKSDLLQLTRGPKDVGKIYTIRSFDPQGLSTDGVPDPYYGGVDGFHITYKIVERSCQGLLDALEAGELEIDGGKE
jgi:protein-tyrosine phosphatase